MTYLMRAALVALLLASLMMLLIGCEQQYTGEVVGNIRRIEFVEAKCPYWEVEIYTGARVDTTFLRSTEKPDIKKDWNYVLVWTLTNRTFSCPTYQIRVPYERETK
jgi:hypothetical protein